MDHMTDAYGEEENPGEIVMEATILPGQQREKTQLYCGLHPNDCHRFCNKLVQDTIRNYSAIQQLAPRMQQLRSKTADILMAERSFLMNNVQNIQSQLENMKRDSRSVSGVNTCFYYVTRQGGGSLTT
jgi:hypothetical protein